MNRLTKNERLCSRKQIEQLLTCGESFFVYPFKVVFNYELQITNYSRQNVSLLIAVPKRRIKKAVARNLIKRRTREAFRLNKQPLYADNDSALRFMLHYVAEEPLPYTAIENAMKTIIAQLGKRYIPIPIEYL